MDTAIKSNASAIDKNTNKIDTTNANVKKKVEGFASGNYKAVTGLAYDATNKKLGLKVGTDTVISFESGIGAAKKVTISTKLNKGLYVYATGRHTIGSDDDHPELCGTITSNSSNFVRLNAYSNAGSNTSHDRRASGYMHCTVFKITADNTSVSYSTNGEETGNVLFKLE